MYVRVAESRVKLPPTFGVIELYDISTVVPLGITYSWVDCIWKFAKTFLSTILTFTGVSKGLVMRREMITGVPASIDALSTTFSAEIFCAQAPDAQNKRARSIHMPTRVWFLILELRA